MEARGTHHVKSGPMGYSQNTGDAIIVWGRSLLKDTVTFRYRELIYTLGPGQWGVYSDKFVDWMLTENESPFRKRADSPDLFETAPMVPPSTDAKLVDRENKTEERASHVVRNFWEFPNSLPSAAGGWDTRMILALANSVTPAFDLGPLMTSPPSVKASALKKHLEKHGISPDQYPKNVIKPQDNIPI